MNMPPPSFLLLLSLPLAVPFGFLRPVVTRVHNRVQRTAELDASEPFYSRFEKSKGSGKRKPKGKGKSRSGESRRTSGSSPPETALRTEREGKGRGGAITTPDIGTIESRMLTKFGQVKSSEDKDFYDPDDEGYERKGLPAKKEIAAEPTSAPRFFLREPTGHIAPGLAESEPARPWGGGDGTPSRPSPVWGDLWLEEGGKAGTHPPLPRASNDQKKRSTSEDEKKKLSDALGRSIPLTLDACEQRSIDRNVSQSLFVY